MSGRSRGVRGISDWVARPLGRYPRSATRATPTRSVGGAGCLQVQPAHFDVVEELARALLPGEAQGMFARLFPREGQRLEARRPQVLVEHAGAGGDDVDRPGRGKSRDRQPARHRLDQHDPERVGARREDEDVGAGVDVGERFAVLGAEKMRVAVAALEAGGAPARRRRSRSSRAGRGRSSASRFFSTATRPTDRKIGRGRSSARLVRGR